MKGARGILHVDTCTMYSHTHAISFCFFTYSTNLIHRRQRDGACVFHMYTRHDVKILHVQYEPDTCLRPRCLMNSLTTAT